MQKYAVHPIQGLHPPKSLILLLLYSSRGLQVRSTFAGLLFPYLSFIGITKISLITNPFNHGQGMLKPYI